MSILFKDHEIFPRLIFEYKSEISNFALEVAYKNGMIMTLLNKKTLSVSFALYIIIAILPLFFNGCKNKSNFSRNEKSLEIDSFPVLIDNIRDCSRLYTTEFKVHKIITHEDQLKLQGKLLSKSFDVSLPLGERKIAIPIDVTLKGYIDFSTITDKNFKQRGNKIEFILPDPVIEITSSKIDHDAIFEDVPLLRSNFKDKELSLYEQQGRVSVEKSLGRLGIVEQARKNAANILIPLISQFGFNEKDIVITFREDYSENSIKLINKNG